jgi:hypothetical protein
VPIAKAAHVLRQAGPQQQDRAALAIVAMHAGAADLDHGRPQVLQAGQVEFALRIEAADRARRVRRQHPIGAHHAQAVRISHDDMVAVRIEHIDVESLRGAGAIDAGTQFLCKHLVAQALGILDLGWCARQAHGQVGLAARLSALQLDVIVVLCQFHALPPRAMGRSYVGQLSRT